jgi:hypothetical protein
LDFTRNTAATDVTLAVQGADDVAGPWTDLAASAGGTPFAVLVPGASAEESGEGPVRPVLVRDAFLVSDPGHPKRFIRLRVTR